MRWGGRCLKEFSLFSVRFYDFILIKSRFFFDGEGALIGMSGNLPLSLAKIVYMFNIVLVGVLRPVGQVSKRPPCMYHLHTYIHTYIYRGYSTYSKLCTYINLTTTVNSGVVWFIAEQRIKCKGWSYRIGHTKT